MGWDNPPVPWNRLEQALSGRPPRPGQGRLHGVVADRGSDRYGLTAAPAEPVLPVAPPARPGPVPYAELHCHSAFSFLDGASTPEQLVAEAARLGLDALALTDHDGLYGIVRFAEAAAEVGLRTIYGAELSLGLDEPQLGVPDPIGEHLLVLARGQAGYETLSRQITAAQLAGGEKGRPVYDLDTLAAAAGNDWVVLTGCRKGAVRRALATGGPERAGLALRRLVDRFGRANVVVELTTHLGPTDDEDNDALAALAIELGLPVVATTGAHYASPAVSRPAAAMAAVRGRRSLDEADPWLPAGPAAHLRSGAEMARLFGRYPTAVPAAAALGRDCAFDLHLVAPQLPPFPVPAGHDENSWLRELTLQRAEQRYGTPESNPAAYAQIDHELAIIAELNFPGYFLVVDDIVSFCRRQGIFCQGRGSAANSAVCYALGITAVDAVKYGLLFERFLAPERDGPPDIDIDIESDTREQVIQYIYDKYGRTYAAQVANVNTFRPRMAVRDMAKALGHSPGQQDAYSKQLDGWTPLATQLANPAATTVVKHEGIEVDFAHLDLEEPAVYEMLQRADSVGVFQVESRAQMATLPRLKPRTFYDLVVEVALIRPGPIQGNSVHPYIRRRNGLEPVTYDHPAMRRSLAKTLGIPLFQEQLMQLAIDVAGFDAGEADQLRRAMGAKRSSTRMAKLKGRLYEGMDKTHGITGPIADRIYERLLAFANFGFAESHALSFAALVFYSSWLKLHHPAAFCAALLRAQPMGFYSPQSLVADARRHGVTVRRPDVNASSSPADLEPGPDGRPAVRLGLAEVRTIGTDLADRIVAARPAGGYASLDQLTRAVTLTSAQAEALATAGALDSLSGIGTAPGSGERAELSAGDRRRRALWAAGAAAGPRAGTLEGTTVGLDAPTLPGMSDVELTVADIWATGISPTAYPTEFSRDTLRAQGVRTAADLLAVDHGTRVLVAGVVTHRQRPGTASGIIFLNLEDETGMVNVICSVGVWSRHRRVARGSRSLLVRGVMERAGGAISIVADRIAAIDLVASTPSRDFR